MRKEIKSSILAIMGDEKESEKLFATVSRKKYKHTGYAIILLKAINCIHCSTLNESYKREFLKILLGFGLEKNTIFKIQINNSLVIIALMYLDELNALSSQMKVLSQSELESFSFNKFYELFKIEDKAMQDLYRKRTETLRFSNTFMTLIGKYLDRIRYFSMTIYAEQYAQAYRKLKEFIHLILQPDVEIFYSHRYKKLNLIEGLPADLKVKWTTCRNYSQHLGALNSELFGNQDNYLVSDSDTFEPIFEGAIDSNSCFHPVSGSSGIIDSIWDGGNRWLSIQKLTGEYLLRCTLSLIINKETQELALVLRTMEPYNSPHIKKLLHFATLRAQYYGLELYSFPEGKECKDFQLVENLTFHDLVGECSYSSLRLIYSPQLYMDKINKHLHAIDSAADSAKIRIIEANKQCYDLIKKSKIEQHLKELETKITSMQSKANEQYETASQAALTLHQQLDTLIKEFCLLGKKPEKEDLIAFRDTALKYIHHNDMKVLNNPRYPFQYTLKCLAIAIGVLVTGGFLLIPALRYSWFATDTQQRVNRLEQSFINSITVDEDVTHKPTTLAMDQS